MKYKLIQHYFQISNDSIRFVVYTSMRQRPSTRFNKETSRNHQFTQKLHFLVYFEFYEILFSYYCFISFIYYKSRSGDMITIFIQFDIINENTIEDHLLKLFNMLIDHTYFLIIWILVESCLINDYTTFSILQHLLFNNQFYNL